MKAYNKQAKSDQTVIGEINRSGYNPWRKQRKNRKQRIASTIMNPRRKQKKIELQLTMHPPIKHFKQSKLHANTALVLKLSLHLRINVFHCHSNKQTYLKKLKKKRFQANSYDQWYVKKLIKLVIGGINRTVTIHDENKGKNETENHQFSTIINLRIKRKNRAPT